MNRRQDRAAYKADIPEVYGSPEAILADKNLDHRGRKKLLQEWEQDEIALLRAADENMARGAAAMPERF